MKKHIRLIMVVVLILLATFALTACGKNELRPYYGTYIDGDGKTITIDENHFTIEDGKSHESASVEYKVIGDDCDKLDLYHSSVYFGSCLLFENYQVAV